MAIIKGKDCKVVYVDTNSVDHTVASMGTWKLDGITADQVETSSFGSNWKSFAFGMKDGGTVTFSGFKDPDDFTGQNTLELLNVNNEPTTRIKLFAGATKYYQPNLTTGYWSPDTAYTTGQDTTASQVYITSFNIGADKSGMMTVDFTAKVTGGPLVLVDPDLWG